MGEEKSKRTRTKAHLTQMTRRQFVGTAVGVAGAVATTSCKAQNALASTHGLVQATAVELFVSAYGDDSNTGTQEKPFRTLLRARNEARSLREGADETTTVTIESGTYRLHNTFELDARDSFTVYRAAEGAQVRISGGMEVSVNDLEPIDDKQILDLLPEASRSRVRKLVLSGELSAGIENWPDRFRGYAGWPEIFVDEKPLHLARWPNTGYAKIGEILEQGSRPRFDDKPDQGGRFTYTEDNPGKWRTDRPVYLGGYWSVRWYDEYIRVESIDSEKKHIQMAAPHQYGIGGPSEGLYYAINLLEELNQPGEYVYDSDRNTLYILLPDEANDVLQVSLLSEPLVRIHGAKNLSFKGIIFENGLDNGIEITDSDSVRLSECTIHQISKTGVDIKGGESCGVDRSRVTMIGMTAINLNGGDRLTLHPSRHFATNSRISHFSRLVKTYTPAVNLTGVGQIVSNNHMHNAPHCAILFMGNDHQMLFNHIEHVCLDTSDAGAIYCGRDFTMGGNRIHGNFIRELGEASHHFNWAIYLDDFASGIEVSRNVIMHTDSAILVGGGRYNLVTDNLMINCPRESIYVDSRGTGWASGHIEDRSFSLWIRLSEISFESGIWQKRFPWLELLEEDAYQQPRHNVLTGNMLYASHELRLHPLAVEHGTVKNNTSEESLPSVRFEAGRLFVTDPDLKPYEQLTFGP